MAEPAATVDSVYRQHARRVFSTLVRLLGSFDLAEEALHDAFLAATEQWPAQGVPANPVARQAPERAHLAAQLAALGG